MNKNKTKEEIIKYISLNNKVSVNALAEVLTIKRIMIQRHLHNLIESGELIKVGIPPKVYYSINKKIDAEKKEYNINPEIIKIIDDNFTLLEPDGVEIEGFEGFVKWCNDEKRKYEVVNKADEYVKLLKEYDNFKKDGFINATQKLTATFDKENQFLNELYYLYPYSFPVFGKTKMGQWLFHAKQTQNKNLIRKVLDIVIPQIENFIKINGVDSLAFVPPTVPRNIQFMKELEKKLQINVPVVKIIKIKTEIMIQQKGLKETTDRIKNAEETMVIESGNTNYNKILILDDFTGSGSTLNILARKIKKQNIAKEVLGLTIAGSMNGFEVIREV
jgi:biotin operon repressor